MNHVQNSVGLKCSASKLVLNWLFTFDVRNNATVNANRQNIVAQKGAFPRFFEGLKMAQVMYKWKGTAAPVIE